MERSSLSASEWRVMEVLWTGPKTLMELVRELGTSAGWAKSTVTTMVRRMEEKGLITYEQSGRAKVFHPAVSRDARGGGGDGLPAGAGVSWQRGAAGQRYGGAGEPEPEDIDELYAVLRKAEEGRL